MFISILAIKLISTVVISIIIFYSGYCLGCNVSDKHFNDR